MSQTQPPPQTQHWEETQRHIIKNDFLICSPLKAPPAATLMSLILFLERQYADIPDAFGLFKNGRRQSVSFAFVADIPTGIKNNSVKQKEESELFFQRRAS